MIEIEVISDKQILKLFDDEEFSYSLKIQDIASLTAIQSSVSTSFKISVLNDYQTLQINSNTNKPYDFIPCNLRVDGVFIFQNGKFAIEEINDDSFLITVYSGNIDFISQIDGLTFADIDFSSIDHEWQFDDVTGSFDNTFSDGFIYPLIQYGPQGLFPDARTEFMHPALFSKFILQEILALTTLSPTGSAYTNAFFERAIMPFATAFRYSRWKRNQAGSVGADTFPIITDIIQFRQCTFDTDSIEIGYRESTDGFLFDTKTRVFGNARIDNDSPVSGIFGIFKLEVDGSIVFLDSVTVPATSDTTYTLSSGDQNFLAGEKVFMAYIIQQAHVALNTFIDYEFRFGFNFINDLMPDIELKDFVKAIFAQFGIISQVNSLTNELELHRFEELGDNKSASIDWSDKLDFAKPFRLEYHPEDYAQLNFFSYKELEQVPLSISKQSFTVVDTTLESSKEWIQLEFGACAEISLFGDNVITIEKYEAFEGDSTDQRATADTQPRLAYIESQVQETTFTDGIDTLSSSPGNRIAARFEDMEFGNLLTTFYEDFVSIFDKYKKITASFRLSQLDIANLDFFTPIFLNVGIGGQMFINGYFYINRVNNYQNDQSTEVELIKINI